MICVNSVSVHPSSVTLRVGNWYYDAYAEFSPANATCAGITWSSDNTNVASVNASSGYIYAIAAGTARIYATATDGSGKSDYITVTVTNSPVLVGSVELNRSSRTLKEGDACSLSATVCPDNADNKSLTWSSSNTNVAMVNGGIVIAVAKGHAIITATAADGSGACDCCDVYVTGDTLVTEVTVNPSSKTMTVGASAYLDATVSPSDATNKCVRWNSSNPVVVTVNPDTGLIMAQGSGTATVYAIAQDGGGASASCVVTVWNPIPAESITVYPESKTIGVGEKVYLSATVCPCDTTNKTVTWRSSNENVATVGTYTGLVTAIQAGTVTITATIADGGYTDDCIITVDPRETVRIMKDGDYFNIQFSDGVIWKSIGCDLSLSENRSPNNIWDTTQYDALLDHEKRYLHNRDESFSVQQIAFIYLLDPLGIEYYMKNDACTNIDTIDEKLRYKDRVYKAIFGEPVQGKFYFTINDGTVRYGTYTGYDRVDVYSCAEVLFGSHVIFDWSNFWEDILKGVFELIPGVSVIETGVEIYQALFHSGSIVGICSDMATSYVEDYVSSQIEDVIENKLGAKAKKAVHWAGNLLSILADATFDSFIIPNLNDITIYNKVKSQNNYLVIFENQNKDLSMQDIIQLCFNANN